MLSSPAPRCLDRHLPANWSTAWDSFQAIPIKLVCRAALVCCLTTVLLNPSGGVAGEDKSGRVGDLGESPEYDLVINGGRVLDPASGFDGIRSLGIKAGKIIVVSETPLEGSSVIDAKGDIVGPGFIDYHAHGGTLLSGRLQAFDGVTTAIEAEVGQLPVSLAYEAAAKEGRAIHYGWTASWGIARMQVLGGITPTGTLESYTEGASDGRWLGPATAQERDAVLALVEESLDQGALGIGVVGGYAPGVPHAEIQKLSQMAAKYGVPLMTHPRFWGGADPGGDIAAIQEVIANAITTGAHWYVCHISLATIDATHEMIAAARRAGARIEVESLVSETGSTFLGAQFLSPAELPNFSRGFVPSDILYYGEPIANEEELVRLRREDPTALIFLLHRDSEQNLEHRATQRASFDFPGTILGSDGMPWQDRQGNSVPGDAWPLPSAAWAHPRSHATYTRFLELWVREWQEFSLMDAFRLGSYNPAHALENEVAAMKNKGRIQVGADADLLIFDLAKIKVNATLENPLPKSEGMRFVIVNGTPIIREGEIDLQAMPGQAIRRMSAMQK